MNTRLSDQSMKIRNSAIVLMAESSARSTNPPIAFEESPPEETTQVRTVLLETMNTSIRKQLWWLAIGERLGKMARMWFVRHGRTD